MLLRTHSRAMLLFGFVALIQGTVRAGAQGALPPAPVFVSANVDGARVTLIFRPSASNPPTRHFVIEAGSTSGERDIAVIATDGFHTIVAIDAVPSYTYYVRIRGANDAGVGPPSDERAVTVVGCSPPVAPFISTWFVGVQSVYLAWSADTSPCPATSYVLEAGSQEGLTDIGAVNLTGTSVTAAPVPPGEYYVRLRGRNADGLGPASAPDRRIFVPDPCLPPLRAIDYRVSMLGNAATFKWSYELPGSPDEPPDKVFPIGVAIEAGSEPGAANLATLPLAPGQNAGVVVRGPAGTYWTRVRTTNACGISSWSNNIAVTLTSECVTPDAPRWVDIVGTPGTTQSVAMVTGVRSPEPGGADITGTVFEAGTALGLSNVRRETFVAGQPPMFAGLAPGTYFGRVRFANACGESAPSPDARFVIGGPCQLPNAPNQATVSVAGGTASFAWWIAAPLFNQPVPASIVEIGTSRGAANVATETGPFGGGPLDKTFSKSLPAGHYFARVRLQTSCGTSNPSIEMEFDIVP